MTTLSELKVLAQAATPAEDWLDDLFADQWKPRTEEYLRAISPKRVLAILTCIEAADAMLDVGIELSRVCVEPPYISDKRAVNDFIGLFDGPLQRAYDAAREALDKP